MDDIASHPGPTEKEHPNRSTRSYSLRGNRSLWLLPVLAGFIFTAGLFYSFSISQNNSSHLIELQEQTYPVLENVSLLKAELKSIQTGFYYAAVAMDMDELVKIREEKAQFLEHLNRLKSLPTNQEALLSTGSLFEEYFQLSEKLSLLYIENESRSPSTQQLIDRVSEKGALLTAAVQKLEKEGAANFKESLKDSEKNSLRILRANLTSAVLGMFLMIAFSVWIALLNSRLSRANDRLESANKNLDQLVKSRTQELESFVYTVSHDLKSPVVSMQGMASMLLQGHGHELSDKARHYTERVISNANYMEELILGLLALSRVGRTTQKLKMTEVREVLEEILALNKEPLKEKNVELVIDPSLPHFTFDHIQLTQVFQNLITNGAKFMGDQPHPRIEIGGREDKHFVEFYVKDNGIGIDPAYHDKIFGIFQRLKEVEVEGTGVGLSIVKKIVELAGGNVRIESRKGEGATFYLKFPKQK